MSERKVCPYLCKKENDYYCKAEPDGDTRQTDYNYRRRCSERFDLCQMYVMRVRYDKLEIPTICPNFDEKEHWCRYDEGGCDMGDQFYNDYRECEFFSHWFWNKRKKEVSENE